MPNRDLAPLVPSYPASAWRRRFWWLCLLVGVFLFASSFSSVRGWMILPLYVHDEHAAGQIAYVMADGPATWERLHAAADLYHMHRIETIVLLNEQQMAGYNFIRRQSDTRLQREIDFLKMLGVPTDKIQSVDADKRDWMSSRSEAVGVFQKLPDVEQVVVVTSPPHTRRSRLCFERTFPETTEIAVYSAAEPSSSAETHLPIWIEYVKLVIYWLLV